MIRAMQVVLVGILLFLVLSLCTSVVIKVEAQSPLPIPTLWVTPTGYILGFTPTPTSTPTPTVTPSPTATLIPTVTSMPPTLQPPPTASSPIILLPETGEEETLRPVDIFILGLIAAIGVWALMKTPKVDDDEFKRSGRWGEG